MNKIFHTDSKIYSFLSHITDMAILNFIYLITCLPILTIGAATSAIYRVRLNYELGKDTNPIKQFFFAIRENYLQSTALFLILLFPIICLTVTIIHIFSSPTIYPTSLLLLAFLAIALVLAIWSFVWPLQAQFSNTTKNILKNALILAMGKVFTAFLMSLMNVIPLLVLFFFPALFLRLMPIWLFVWHSVSTTINTKLFLKILHNLSIDITSDDTIN